MIEDGKPIGVVLTMEEYEKLTTLEVGAPIPTQGREADQGIGSESVGAELADIGLADDVMLEDLGLDELPY